MSSKQNIKNALGLSGVVRGDFVKLAQKHPEYFSHPKEVKALSDSVFSNAHLGLLASDYGSVAFIIQNINREHRIRSVMLMGTKQVEFKIKKAKKLGEPIFQF